MRNDYTGYLCITMYIGTITTDVTKLLISHQFELLQEISSNQILYIGTTDVAKLLISHQLELLQDISSNQVLLQYDCKHY